MKRIVFIFALILTVCISCNRVSKKAKDTINRTGEAVGETATEFFEGVAEGVDKTLECEITISKSLEKKGIKAGTFSIDKINPGANKNKLTLYLIFEKDFKGDLIAKAYDKKGLEIGRSKIQASGKAQEAGYFDFLFDERTDIGVRNKITISE